MRVSIHRKESQTLENNFREILFLIEEIDVLKALLRDIRDGLHGFSWTADGDHAEGWDHTEVVDEVMWALAGRRGSSDLQLSHPQLM